MDERVGGKTSCEKQTKLISISQSRRRSLAESAGWRYEHPSLVDKLSFILSREKLFHDVTFLVGEMQEKVFAHKFVLVVSSSVFEAMFNGDLAPKEDEFISIPDVQPSAFRIMLKFIYSGELDSQFTEADLAPVDVLYVAKKYDIPELVTKTVNLLSMNLRSTNAITIYEAAHLFDETDLRDQAHAYINKNFWKIVTTEDFLHISHKTLCHFIQQDQLNIFEIELFDAAIRWAEAECSRQELEQIPRNHRRVLNWALNLIRFPVMSLIELSLQVVPKRVLLADEAVSLFQHMAIPRDQRSLLPKLWFNDTSRAPYKKSYTAHFCKRFTDEPYYYEMTNMREDSFEVDHPISLISAGFPSPDVAPPITYDITVGIWLKEKPTPLGMVKTTLRVLPASIFHVEFPQPIPLKPNVHYTVTYTLNGPITHYIKKKSKEIQIYYDTDDIVNFKYHPHHRQLVEVSFTVV